MNVVAKLLSLDNILIDVEVGNKEGLLENVAQFFEWRYDLKAPLIYASLRAREDLGSTAIGHSVAIPHTRIKGLSHTLGAFVRMRHAIDFEAGDGLAVSMALILLVPEHVNKEHLDMLAAAADMFSNKRFRYKLQHTNSTAETYQAFVDWPKI